MSMLVTQPEYDDSGEILNAKVIYECPLDGSQALSFLSPSHVGPVALCYSSPGKSFIRWVGFPNSAEAELAACIAARHDVCGYTDVQLHPLSAAPATINFYDSAVECFL